MRWLWSADWRSTRIISLRLRCCRSGSRTIRDCADARLFEVILSSEISWSNTIYTRLAKYQKRFLLTQGVSRGCALRAVAHFHPVRCDGSPCEWCLYTRMTRVHHDVLSIGLDMMWNTFSCHGWAAKSVNNSHYSSLQGASHSNHWLSSITEYTNMALAPKFAGLKVAAGVKPKTVHTLELCMATSSTPKWYTDTGSTVS